MKYPKHLLKLIELLKHLPGVGNKSAMRFAFRMIDWKAEKLHEMAKTIEEIPLKLVHCTQCGCLVGEDPCPFCEEPRTQAGSICVVASPRDAFAIESTHEYKGLYHVLGNLLSPMEGIGPEQLNLTPLKNRISDHHIKELVIALDSTLEGDATALYLKREFGSLPIKISRLAFGLPLGSTLDYVDGGTLARALSARSNF